MCSSDLAFASANRDERQFGCPAEFHANRDNIREHLAFGRGAHLCPGATLARAETRIATRTFLSRFSSVRMAPGCEAQYHPNLVHRMVEHLPLVVTAMEDDPQTYPGAAQSRCGSTQMTLSNGATT